MARTKIVNRPPPPSLSDHSASPAAAADHEDEDVETLGTQFQPDGPGEIYEAECILDERATLRKKEYLVKWAGLDKPGGKPWPHSWEPRNGCSDDLIQDWKARKARDPKIVGLYDKRGKRKRGSEAASAGPAKRSKGNSKSKSTSLSPVKSVAPSSKATEASSKQRASVGAEQRKATVATPAKRTRSSSRPGLGRPSPAETSTSTVDIASTVKSNATPATLGGAKQEGEAGPSRKRRTIHDDEGELPLAVGDEREDEDEAIGNGPRPPQKLNSNASASSILSVQPPVRRKRGRPPKNPRPATPSPPPSLSPSQQSTPSPAKRPEKHASETDAHEPQENGSKKRIDLSIRTFRNERPPPADDAPGKSGKPFLPPTSSISTSTATPNTAARRATQSQRDSIKDFSSPADKSAKGDTGTNANESLPTPTGLRFSGTRAVQHRETLIDGETWTVAGERRSEAEESSLDDDYDEVPRTNGSQSGRTDLARAAETESTEAEEGAVEESLSNIATKSPPVHSNNQGDDRIQSPNPPSTRGADTHNLPTRTGSTKSPEQINSQPTSATRSTFVPGQTIDPRDVQEINAQIEADDADLEDLKSNSSGANSPSHSDAEVEVESAGLPPRVATRPRSLSPRRTQMLEQASEITKLKKQLAELQERADRGRNGSTFDPYEEDPETAMRRAEAEVKERDARIRAMATEAHELRAQLEDMGQRLALAESSGSSDSRYETLQEQYAFMRQQYDNASNSAVAAVNQCQKYEDQIEILKGQLSVGLRQREIFNEAVKKQRDDEMTRLRQSNNFLLEQARRTDDLIRKRAAAYPKLQTENDDLRREISEMATFTARLEARNENLSEQVTVLRARQMGVLGDDTDAEDDMYESEEDDYSSVPSPRTRGHEDIGGFTSSQIMPTESQMLGDQVEIKEPGSGLWCKWRDGATDERCPMAFDNLIDMMDHTKTHVALDTQ